MSDIVQYLTIEHLARHTGKNADHLRRLAVRGVLPAEKTPGIKGYRITVPKANRFLARHWPDIPRIKPGQYLPEGAPTPEPDPEPEPEPIP